MSSKIDRRRFLFWFAGVLASTIWSSKSWAGDRSLFLKDYAAKNDLLYGAATLHSFLRRDKDFARRFVEECAILVPENDFKWYKLRPTPQSFDFTKADWLVNFAEVHDLKLRGHTLVWYQALPDWFAAEVNATNAAEHLTNHINTLVGRYAGKIHSWDVVNEAIEPKDGRDDGLRITPWLKYLGEEYIELAFRTAAAADPQALLTYNDYDLAYDTPEHEARRTATLNLLERLKAKDVPVGALGMQAHLDAGKARFNAKKLQRFMQNVADLGLKILVTELDVVDRSLEAPSIFRDRAVANIYREYLEIVLTQPAVIAVITWGLSDRYTWLKKFRPRDDGAYVRPLPLDRDLQPKLAWKTLAHALRYF
ncbi:endo-1,4-beta-xylanase [Pleurocapsales cyanobacterium LEGE 10410]|nr:endo-1,4-beta-xylanase [Pleurocapsales cyanobacterium LEGE 10410]